jgi:hypothetical protein
MLIAVAFDAIRLGNRSKTQGAITRARRHRFSLIEAGLRRGFPIAPAVPTGVGHPPCNRDAGNQDRPR